MTRFHTVKTHVPGAALLVHVLRIAVVRGGELALLLAFAILWLPFGAEAQQTGKVWRIAILTADRPGAVEALVDGLRELNYAEGRNFVLERRRFTRIEELPGVAAEIVKLEPDVIVTGHGVAALALKAATTTVPIVMAASSDAVAQGVIASLARPGGNVTGFTNMASDLATKRLEILREAVPQASRIGVLACPEVARTATEEWTAVERAARSRGLGLVPIFIRGADELPEALESAMRQKVDAILVLECAIYPRPENVTGVLNKARVPVMYPTTRWVQGGGLMCYGPNSTDQYRRAAVFVDKILKGAKPADLPVEQPAKFDFAINLKTMRAQGLTIPKALLMRADSVIE